MNNEERLQAKALSQILHGKFQSGLFANLIKLRAAADAESSVRVVKEVRENLLRLLNSAKLSDESKRLTVGKTLSPVRKLWEDVAKISLEFEPSSLAQKIENDAVLMANVSELCAELTFNSIKHGEANTITSKISRASSNTVELLCTDNGSNSYESMRVGLGTKLLNECALSWQRQITPGSHGTRTQVLLTFLPSELSQK